MNEELLRKAVSTLPISGLRYFDTIGSTNDAAIEWAENGAPDGSLVVCNAQSAGRGRMDRQWFTPADSALAFSVILRPEEVCPAKPALYSLLGALSVHHALQEQYGLSAEIKWPNDVLLQRKKVAGVLAESAWLGGRLEYIVLGIGVNVLSKAIPPQGSLLFPAASVEQAVNHPVERLPLLIAILQAVWHWRPLLGSAHFFRVWEDSLAFRHEQVILHDVHNQKPPMVGVIKGVDSEGNLRLQNQAGLEETIAFGEVRLRPAENHVQLTLEG